MPAVEFGVLLSLASILLYLSSLVLSFTLLRVDTGNTNSVY